MKLVEDESGFWLHCSRGRQLGGRWERGSGRVRRGKRGGGMSGKGDSPSICSSCNSFLKM